MTRKMIDGGEEATPVEHQKEHKIGDFARKYGDYM